jgi:hypothetical protein
MSDSSNRMIHQSASRVVQVPMQLQTTLNIHGRCQRFSHTWGGGEEGRKRIRMTLQIEVTVQIQAQRYGNKDAMQTP